MIDNFLFAKIPHTLFGAGEFNKLPGLIDKYPGAALILTGRSSLEKSGLWEKLESALKNCSKTFFSATVPGEPSPELIDSINNKYSPEKIGCIVSIGGGSVLDAGKAVSAMLGKKDSVKEYLEGIGSKKHNGGKIPFIAVPTTSGTGSEATKNAVLSIISERGFKKSLRHDRFVPDIAIVDPELTTNCSPGITAACGMDAFTQLLESYVSRKGSPMTDALALSGLERINKSLIRAYDDGHDIAARTDMSYASYLSGITLANAGLGVVHGFASPIGAFFNAPHGVVCGTLLGISTELTIEKLRFEDPENIALKKYANAGRIFSRETEKSDQFYCDSLIEVINELSEELKVPLLGKYSVTEKQFNKIIKETGLKNNPADLQEDDLRRILEERT